MKRVLLKFGKGSLQQGCDSVVAELIADNQPMQRTGSLPPCSHLADLYYRWQTLYRSRNENQGTRIHLTSQLGIRFSESEFQAVSEQLAHALNVWLNADTFRSVDQTLRMEFHRTDEIQVVIETNDPCLRRLPWHLWSFFDDYSKAEVSLSALDWQERKPAPRNRSKVRVLAVLGDSRGIDVKADRQLLSSLSEAELVFLDQPNQQILNEHLWDQSGWDILFFAGHSQTEADSGRIYINDHDHLTVNQLNKALGRAIENGLKIAIFNSCDGLGLAIKLSNLHIPHVVFMREPVPDRVAHSFLKSFLQSFADGQPFPLAVREARERLESLEGEFPCASWLPLIWQNPTAPSITWNDLNQQSPKLSSQKLSSQTRSRRPIRHQIGILLGVSATVAGLIMGCRYLKLLEPIEMVAYDYLVRQRPAEAIDPRVLVVEITQEDTNQYDYPPSDDTLANLIDKLEQYQPAAIGLDLHRAKSRGAGQNQLKQRIDANPNIFLVCAYSSTDENLAPPPFLNENQLINQIGFSDLPVDNMLPSSRERRNDVVAGAELATESLMVRRQILSYSPELAASPSPCSTPYSFSFQLAYQYLYQTGVEPLTVNDAHQWQFGQTVFSELTPRFGGYQSLEGLSSQILVNYRSNPPGQRLTMSQIMTGQVNATSIQGRIVLVGYTSPVARDYLTTPYGTMAGVWVHAHMVSQMVSAVMDQRPLIWALPQSRGIQWGDTLFVLSWSLVGALIAWGLSTRSLAYLICALALALALLHQVCLTTLTRGGWLPLVPSATALLSTSVLTRGFKDLALTPKDK